MIVMTIARTPSLNASRRLVLIAPPPPPDACVCSQAISLRPPCVNSPPLRDRSRPCKSLAVRRPIAYLAMVPRRRGRPARCRLGTSTDASTRRPGGSCVIAHPKRSPPDVIPGGKRKEHDEDRHNRRNRTDRFETRQETACGWSRRTGGITSHWRGHHHRQRT